MIENKRFENDSVLDLAIEDYFDCTFSNCLFMEFDLSQFEFSNCSFYNCIFAQVNLAKTSFRDVQFIDCKMQGLRFDMCNHFLLAIHLSSCQLDYSSFFRLDLKKSTFENCRLIEVDFVEADLSNSMLINCDLSGAIFDRSNLVECDLSDSVNLVLDPEKNKITGMKISSDNILGLLSKYNLNVY